MEENQRSEIIQRNPMPHVLKMTNAQILINLNLETWQLIKLC